MVQDGKAQVDGRRRRRYKAAAQLAPQSPYRCTTLHTRFDSLIDLCEHSQISRSSEYKHCRSGQDSSVQTALGSQTPPHPFFHFAEARASLHGTVVLQHHFNVRRCGDCLFDPASQAHRLLKVVSQKSAHAVEQPRRQPASMCDTLESAQRSCCF